MHRFNHLSQLAQINAMFLMICVGCLLMASTLFGQNADAKIFNPGDAIEISVFPDTSSFLNNIYPIDGNGNIFLPLVGQKNISRLGESEIKQYLLMTYKEYLKFPNLQLRPLIRISALGGFTRPGLYYVDPNYPLWNVIHRAGGTVDESGLKKMRWERQKKKIQKNLIPLIESNQSMAAMGFKSGDQIWTPTPNKPNKLRSLVSDVLPLATMGITIYTFYYFTQTGRRSYNQ